MGDARRDHHLVTGRKWGQQAEENVDEWGRQPPIDLGLAMIEELGELAHELAAMTEPARDRDAEILEGWHLLMEAADLGRRTREHLEEHHTDEQGNPLPREAQPTYGVDYWTPARAEDELADLAALCYQLAWTLNEVGIDE